MLEIVLALLVAGWGVLYYRVRDVFAPWSITLLVWMVILSSYLFLDHGLYRTNDDFALGVGLWCLCFAGVGYVVFRLTPANVGAEWEANDKIVKLFTVAAVIITPFALVKAASFAMASGSSNLMNTMRTQVIDKDSGFSLGPIVYFVHVIYAILLVSADATKRWNKWFFVLCMIVNFLFFFVLMSKLILFIGLLSTLYLSYVHKRISLRTIGIICLLFGFVGLFFTQLRTSSDGDTDTTYTLMDLLLMYVLSPVSAFGLENPCSSPVWGYETFRPIYGILQNLGLYFGPVYDLKRDFVMVPIPTNVYTMMAPFYNDFGVPGIAAMGAVEGGIVAWIYKKGATGHTLARNLYAYLTAVIALQFFDEQFFVGLSNILQMVVLIFICHIKPVWKPKDKFLIS